MSEKKELLYLTKIRIYLDNCCYNRPYDDQTQMRIHLETEAKLYIQKMIVDGEVNLVTSYVLEYENSRNRVLRKRQAIADFISENEAYYVGAERRDTIEREAKLIMKTGVKEKDALHVACSIYAGCDYFITTDDRILKYQPYEVTIVTPGEFIRRMEAEK